MSMFEPQPLKKLMETIFEEAFVVESMELEDVYHMINMVHKDVEAMSESEVRQLYGRYEVAQRVKADHAPPEDKEEDDDAEPADDDGMEFEDTVYLDRVLKIIQVPNMFQIEDPIDFNLCRDVCVLCYKHFIGNRVKKHKFFTMELMDLIVKRNGDLYEDLNAKERKKVKALLRPLEHERVWSAMSKRNFFDAHFGCTPREYFDKANAEKAKARKAKKAPQGGIAKKARKKGPKAPVAAARKAEDNYELACERMC